MIAYGIFNFLHILVFAVIIGIELPALHALRMAGGPSGNQATRSLAVRVKRYADAVSAIMLVPLLPLGVQIASQLGVWTLSSSTWLYATWAVGLAWLAIAVIAETGGASIWARRIYKTECVLRIVIGLGNVYDALSTFIGGGMIQTNWLAAKVLLFGLVLVVSGWIRWQTRAVRFASVDAGAESGPDPQQLIATIRRAQWGSHSILAMVLIAAYLGTAKPW
ncbi:MAG: hypothetical protein OXI11_10050 [Gammaproteobacteria bacterium]|nr:hypothetical protein [Gammaproteobacteria bacterium]MXW44963.1 hypothetical protein [Gammaproteobacteria bacterium]MYD02555.1 hypothetical protein [Gammaproteobacteria bacterium]MYI25330.1 hypothetical protein [Gammaproteobacteria bacterium]